VLSILVLEDLAVAVYLPLVAVLLAGGGPTKLALSELVAIATVVLVVGVATRYGQTLSRLAAHESDEIVLLTTFGTVLLVAGLAERAHVSSAIGAFLVGIAASGPIAESAIGCWPRCETSLRPCFSFSSDWRLIRRHCPMPSHWRPGWQSSQRSPKL
jgi:CPA2 family monovalent cation:H+ antiporter-2